MVSTWQTPLSITVGDFNRDGILDLAIANMLDATVMIYLATGLETLL